MNVRSVWLILFVLAVLALAWGIFAYGQRLDQWLWP